MSSPTFTGLSANATFFNTINTQNLTDPLIIESDLSLGVAKQITAFKARFDQIESRSSYNIAVNANLLIAVTKAISGNASFFNTIRTQNGRSFAGVDVNALQYWRGNAARLGGFSSVFRWGVAKGTTARYYVGFSSATTIGSVNPSSQLNILAFGADVADGANMRFFHNDGSGVATKIDLGSNFPSRSTTDFYETRISCHPNSSEISYSIWNMTTNLYASGTVSSKNSK